MSRVPGWCTAAMLAVGLMAGCGGSGSGGKTDGGSNNNSPTQICTPNQATCANDTTATICTANGLALVPVQCGANEKCDGGACKANANAPCTSADNTCMDATHAIVCGPGGVTSVACPANTACQSGGVCAGACIVGSAICTDSGSIATCTDGNHYTTTACGAGMNCVSTGTSPYDTAACTASGCTPDPNGCDAVCGDRTTGGTGTSANTVSTCVATPTGYQWLATTCTASSTCSPSGASCNSGSQAACTSVCTPGETRCDGYFGVQTCGSDGTWSATAKCNSDSTLASACFTTRAGTAVCGDAVCVNGNQGEADGACDADGGYHLCGPDGKVSATVTACPNGAACIGNGFIAGSYASGACQSDCNEGEQHCLGSVSYQTCSHGIFGNAIQCAADTQCITYQGTSGLTTVLCGQCAPGTTRCVTPDGGGAQQIETCSTAGVWSTAQSCAIGSCKTPTFGEGNTLPAACTADCVAGKTVCIGDYNGSAAIGIDTQTQSGVCTPQYTLPAPGSLGTTDCTETNTLCRTSASGASYGCVACVDTYNEFGLPDTYCDYGGDSQSVVTCVNGAFDTAHERACTGNNSYCESASNDIPAPTSNGTCSNGPFGVWTESNVEAAGFTCQNAFFFGNQGAPIQCGSTPDCCSNDCDQPNVPYPAYCDNGD